MGTNLDPEYTRDRILEYATGFDAEGNDELTSDFFMEIAKQSVVTYIVLTMVTWPAVGLWSLAISVPMTMAVYLFSLCGVVPILGPILFAGTVGDAIITRTEGFIGIDLDHQVDGPNWLDWFLSLVFQEKITIEGSARDALIWGGLFLAIGVSNTVIVTARARLAISMAFSWISVVPILLLVLIQSVNISLIGWLEWPFPFQRSFSLTPWQDDPVSLASKVIFYLSLLSVCLLAVFWIWFCMWSWWQGNRAVKQWRAAPRTAR